MAGGGGGGYTALPGFLGNIKIRSNLGVGTYVCNIKCINVTEGFNYLYYIEVGTGLIIDMYTKARTIK